MRLAEHLAALDAARFVGRADALASVDRFLSGDTLLRVLLVHGPGGIGKSTLLREIGRRARAAGRPLWTVDARALEPVPGELERLLEGATEAPSAVITIDSFEHAHALDSLLRERILPALAADALVVVAGRREPESAWFRDGWEHVTGSMRLRPLTPQDARSLLEVRGITDPPTVDSLIELAAGSPLALSLASAGMPTQDRDLQADLNKLIVRRLAGDELDPVDSEVLEVAAVARAVDTRLLAAVLPGRATRAAADALRKSTVAEMMGGRITLHDLVRSCLRDELRQRDRQRYDQLRQAIADHLLARAATGEARLLPDVIELIDDPEVRWGVGGYAHDRFRIDPWDHEAVTPMIDSYLQDHEGEPQWWETLAALVAEEPEAGLIARGVDGQPVAFCVATSVARAGPATARDPLLGPALADARARDLSDAMLYRETHRARADVGSSARGVLTLAAVLRSGLPNVSRSYIFDTLPGRESRAFFEAVGARREATLDGQIAGETITCWVVDHGPAGMLGQIREVIRAETNTSPPDQRERRPELEQAAIAALRDLGRMDVLARNPLSQLIGGPASERVPRLKELLRQAAEQAFGPEAADRLLYEVVVLGDLTPAVTHEQAMAKVSVSRATYFRHLRKARQRVAVVLVELLLAQPGPGVS